MPEPFKPSVIFQGKEAALKALAERRANPPKQVDNSSLYAGSPMYFYCRCCGHLSDVLPESYTTRPKSLCSDCNDLNDKGWLD
jgi:hypothetical protein